MADQEMTCVDGTVYKVTHSPPPPRRVRWYYEDGTYEDLVYGSTCDKDISDASID